MLFNSLLLPAFFGSLASAATHKVAVGSGGLKYDPASLTAAVGDTIEFDFSNVSHDVVQSSFDKPCSPASNGFYVSPQSSSSASFTITVNDTNPIYYYCSVGKHCTSGMVGIVNPSDKSQSDFANAANSATKAAPSDSNGVVGGTLSNGSGASSGTSTSTKTVTSSTTNSASSSATSSGSAASSASAASSTSSGGARGTAVPAALGAVAVAVVAYM